MTDEEKQRAKDRHKQELQVLKEELATLPAGRAVYVDRLGPADAAAGNVFFKISNEKNLTQLKSNLEKELKKLK